MRTTTLPQKIISVLLSITLVSSFIPGLAYADEPASDQSNQANQTSQTSQDDSSSSADNTSSTSGGSNSAASDSETNNGTARTGTNNSNSINSSDSDSNSNNSSNGSSTSDAANQLAASEENLTNENEEGDQANSWRYVDGEQFYSYEGATTEALDPNAPAPYAAASGASSYATWYQSNGTTSYTYKETPSSSGQVINVSGVKRVGIDVSYHQGTIDWAKVKNSGVSFAIIRCGYGSDFTSQDDTQFLNNVKGAQENGIDIGIYLYSYAMNTTGTDSSATSEAQHVLRLLDEAGLEPQDLAYPIFYDLEEDKQAALGSSKLGELATTFCSIISDAGYEVGIYANLNWWTNYLTDSVFDNSSWHKWVARYPGTNKATSSGVSGTEIWQFFDCGNVDGISGNVDMNFDYVGSYGINYEEIDQQLDELASQNADVLADGIYMIRLASTNT